MKKQWILISTLALGLLLAAAVGLALAQGLVPQGPQAPQAPLGTGFTYQGKLEGSSGPISATCTLAFRLYDQAGGGAQVGSALTRTVPISDGLFTVSLDFGAAAFTGDERWLGIQASCPGDAAFTDLGRQELTAAPYALYALNSTWSGLAGVPAGFADGVDNDTTYSAGAGLLLTGTTFSANTAYLQRRLASCPGGQVLVNISADGAAICEFPLPPSWSLTGNAFTISGTHFLGTTDNQPLELRVNNARALRLEPYATSPNLIGGYSGNSVTSGAYGATIGGGGASGNANRVTDAYGTVGGGRGNQAGDNAGATSDMPHATVGGGCDNTASGNSSTVSGGCDNTASGTASTIGGGYNITVTDRYATVGGGQDNIASGDYATIGGGGYNTASNYHATVGGGWDNTASGNSATVGGGWDNTASDDHTTISGGSSNIASGQYAAVGGGVSNAASSSQAAVGGGGSNIASNDNATIGGGLGNQAGGYASTIGGGWNNHADSDRAAIGGGASNVVTGTFGAIAGGQDNSVGGSHATVGGGYSNEANRVNATVGGGRDNTASGSDATVSGGWSNTASHYDATVGGGVWNTASGESATVSGGEENTASGHHAAIGGGYQNIASVNYATIGGGWSNEASGQYATVGGGADNIASGEYATVGGGGFNTASGLGAVVAGGGGISGMTAVTNTASGDYSAIGGGVWNTASGAGAVIPGGNGNIAQGENSFAAGTKAYAQHNGAFVWGDNTYTTLPSPAANTFVVRAAGGIWLGATSAPSIPAGRFLNTSTGGYLTTGGAWTDNSDRNLKENFAPVDGREVLARVAELPITTWNYQAEDAAVRHMGPVAQDFYAAFGLGQDGTHIAALDTGGVALAAIQGLYNHSQEQAARIEELEAQVAALQQQNADFEARLAALEQDRARGAAPSALPLAWLFLGGLALAGGAVVQRRRSGGGL